MISNIYSSTLAYFKKETFDVKLFLILSFIFGMSFVFCSAPMQGPDEALHYWRGFQISNFDLSANKYGDRFGARVPREVNELGTSYSSGLNPKAKLNVNAIKTDIAKHNYGNYEVVYFENTAVYSPMGYLPISTVMVIGRLLSIPHFLIFYLSRIINLLFYIIVFTTAIRLIPFGKKIMVLIGLLPMSLYLASSISIDGIIISLSALSVAIMLNVISSQQTKNERNKLLLMFIVILSLAITKYTYASFALLFILVSKKYYGKGRLAIYLKLLSIAAPLLVAAIWSHAVSDIAGTIHKVLRPQELIDPISQLRFIIEYPVRFVFTMINTLIFKNSSLIMMSFIGIFGWLDIALPFFLYLFAPVVFILAIFYERSKIQKKLVLPLKSRAFLISLALLTLLSILISLYIGYSPLKSTFIDGIQGRYFIPVICILAPVLIVNDKRIKISEKQINQYIFTWCLLSLSFSIFAIVNANVLRFNY